MDIGEPLKKITVIPTRNPVPATAPKDVPVKEPVKEPEKVDAR